MVLRRPLLGPPAPDAVGGKPNISTNSSAQTPFHDDVEIEAGVYLGEWLRQEIDNSVFVEKSGHFPDKVARIAQRLQRDRPPERRLLVEIPWISLFTAFTPPGRYIYFARRLLERCPTEETVAFVIAHEIAHHDLGHFRIFQRDFARRTMRFGPGAMVVLFFRVLQHHVYSVEWENAADSRALQICLDADYNGYRCLKIFDVFEKEAFYQRDFDAVYGLDVDSDQELSAEATLLTKARIWLYLKRRGYLPIQDRKARLREELDTINAAPARPSPSEL
jgi:peptidase M48-like protein